MKSFFLLTYLLFFINPVKAQDYPAKPKGFVTDLAGILKANEIQVLNQIIRAIADSTSNEIAVVIFPDAQGYEYGDFARTVAETWGIGNKKRNNGVLIALFMKERGYSFQVGYGLEPVLTDLSTRRIFDNYMKPAFRRGAYYEGLAEAITVTGAIAAGEFSFSGEYGAGDDLGKDIAGIIVLVIIFAIIFLMAMSRRGGGGKGGGSLMAALPYLLMGTHMAGGRHQGWGSGGGGGGFGGFGGGSFGGGGSSGSW